MFGGDIVNPILVRAEFVCRIFRNFENFKKREGKIIEGPG